MPNHITSIEADTFRECISLTSITIPNSVTSIGWAAFYDCTSLNSVTIGTGVESIEEWAFVGCTNLTSVYISDISKWCDIQFSDYRSNPLEYAGNLYLNGELVTELVIPDGATSIGDYAFYSCTSLTSVTIPDSVTIIGEDAFYYCTNITNVTIPDSVIRIGDHAFYNSKNLTIYCEATTKPNGWSSLWIYNPSPVVWGYKG